MLPNPLWRSLGILIIHYSKTTNVNQVQMKVMCYLDMANITYYHSVCKGIQYYWIYFVFRIAAIQNHRLVVSFCDMGSLILNTRYSAANWTCPISIPTRGKCQLLLNLDDLQGPWNSGIGWEWIIIDILIKRVHKILLIK